MMPGEGKNRLDGKVAVVVGAGQTPGSTMGNGRATALLFAREGARVFAIDRDPDSAAETVSMIEKDGGQALVGQADILDEESIKSAIQSCLSSWNKIDILHNNVGVSIAGGDSTIDDFNGVAFDQVNAINLRGMIYTCKHVLPVMRAQESGSIVNISSIAARECYPLVAYKTSKAGVIAFTEQLAYTNAQYGIRANVILPGLMNTPMAIEPRVAVSGKTHAQVVAERDARVPLGKKMGSAWDVANAALFLASDEAGFITGVSLPVDGGACVMVG